MIYRISWTGGHIVDVHTVAIVVVSVTIVLNVGYVDDYVGYGVWYQGPLFLAWIDVNHNMAK